MSSTIFLGKAFEEIKRLKARLHDENVALREQIDQVFMFDVTPRIALSVGMSFS